MAVIRVNGHVFLRSPTRFLAAPSERLYCAVFRLNSTANQSCFSPFTVFFHCATDRGRCAERSPNKDDVFFLFVFLFFCCSLWSPERE